MPRHSILKAMAAACLMACSACSQLCPAPGKKPSHDHHLLKIKIAETGIIEKLEQDPAAQRLVKEICSHDLTFVANIGPGFLWVIATDEELDFLRLRGHGKEQVMQGPELELHKRMVWWPNWTLPPAYHEYEEVVASLEALHRQHPQITALHMIGRTEESARPI